MSGIQARLAEAEAHGKAQQRWAHEWRDKHDALTAENAALRDERALIIQRAENAEAALVAETAKNGRHAMRVTIAQLEARLAEAEALLMDIAEMRVPVLPSRFMDESMAEAARAYLARKP